MLTGHFGGAVSSGTDQPLVTAAAGRRIRVLSLVVAAAATTTLVFNSKGASAGTPISQTFQVPAGGLVLPLNAHGWFETNVGEGLTCTPAAAVQMDIDYGARL